MNVDYFLQLLALIYYKMGRCLHGMHVYMAFILKLKKNFLQFALKGAWVKDGFIIVQMQNR